MTAASAHLAQQLTPGRPQHAGPLTVFPIFGGEPRLDYQSFAQGQAAGVTVGELPGGASVNDLLVVNPTPLPVLLFEGEEVLGAQQNRTFDATVLVPAGAKLQVPVSCVEAGRWDGTRHGEGFAAAPQAAYPQLRRSKNAAARAAAAHGLEARAEQGAVWDDVARKSRRLAAPSDTAAMHDVFERHRRSLDELCAGIPRQDHQVGALVAIAGRPVVLDVVSRPDVWAALHRPLVQGYALDALEVVEGTHPPATAKIAGAFLAAALEAPARQRAAVGAGHHLDLDTPVASGIGLVVDDELVQLSAFAPDRPASARIHRPSRRR